MFELYMLFYLAIYLGLSKSFSGRRRAGRESLRSPALVQEICANIKAIAGS